MPVVLDIILETKDGSKSNSFFQNSQAVGETNEQVISMHLMEVSFFFGLLAMTHYTACGILVPRQGIEPTPSTLGAHSLNH